jgi:hypothetical protein
MRSSTPQRRAGFLYTISPRGIYWGPQNQFWGKKKEEEIKEETLAETKVEETDSLAAARKPLLVTCRQLAAARCEEE